MSRLTSTSTPLLLAFAASCGGPDAYASPIKRKPLTVPGRCPVGISVNMNDSKAEANIVRGISRTIESGTWRRWAYKRPEMRFFPASLTDRKLAIDFTIAAGTLKQTGPFFVDNHLLDKVRYENFGEQHCEKPVPAPLLKPDSDTIVAMEPDKTWISWNDGVRLGFILTRAGFAH